MQEFGPQNDRPNLSVLAPVTKDGRPASMCLWLVRVWVTLRVIGRIMFVHSLFTFWAKCECQYFVCVRHSFYLLFSDCYSASVFTPAQFRLYTCTSYCMSPCCQITSLKCKWGGTFQFKYRQWFRVSLQSKIYIFWGVFCWSPDASFDIGRPIKCQVIETPFNTFLKPRPTSSNVLFYLAYYNTRCNIRSSPQTRTSPVWRSKCTPKQDGAN